MNGPGTVISRIAPEERAVDGDGDSRLVFGRMRTVDGSAIGTGTVSLEVASRNRHGRTRRSLDAAGNIERGTAVSGTITDRSSHQRNRAGGRRGQRGKKSIAAIGRSVINENTIGRGQGLVPQREKAGCTPGRSEVVVVDFAMVQRNRAAGTINDGRVGRTGGSRPVVADGALEGVSPCDGEVPRHINGSGTGRRAVVVQDAIRQGKTLVGINRASCLSGILAERGTGSSERTRLDHNSTGKRRRADAVFTEGTFRAGHGRIDIIDMNGARPVISSITGEGASREFRRNALDTNRSAVEVARADDRIKIGIAVVTPVVGKITIREIACCTRSSCPEELNAAAVAGQMPGKGTIVGGERGDIFRVDAPAVAVVIIRSAARHIAGKSDRRQRRTRYCQLSPGGNGTAATQTIVSGEGRFPIDGQG